MEFGWSGTNVPGEAGHQNVQIFLYMSVDIKQAHFRVLMSKLRLSFHGLMGSGHLGQAELYPDYWNFKIVLGKGQHIVNKVLKSRILMYGSLYLIKSQLTTKSNFRTKRPFEPKMLPRLVSSLFNGIWKIWHQRSRRSGAPRRRNFFVDVRRHKTSPLSSPYE